jgi:ABC-type sugar transport system ATPase subunit
MTTASTGGATASGEPRSAQDAPSALSGQPGPASPPADSGTPRLQMTGMTKRFGAVRAIRHADLTVHAGRVLALVGENGAGKSTLIKILSGAVVADSGTITYEGREVSISSTSDAMGLGIATVYQEPQLFSELTVSENIFLGREIRKGGRIDWAAQNRRVVDLLALLDLPPRYATAVVGDLSIAEQQQVSIAKALAGDASILILDEPSAILTDAEIEVLFRVVRRLTDSGVSVIYISHRLDELFRIAHDVLVMRDGRTIGTYPIEELSVRKVVELMVGGILSEIKHERTIDPKTPPRLELASLGRRGEYHDVNVSVRPGEIVGLYGLVGSGVSEIADSIYGIDHADSGQILFDGRPVRPRSPRHAQRVGIGLLPANRKQQGMFSFQSIMFNISAGHLPLLSKARVWMDRGRERQVARDMIKRLAVKTPSENQPIGAMSGGNAQKVVLARQLVERPEVLVLAEPTQGVDVGAKEEIHRLIAELADAGTAVLVVTSDLPEAIRISDRLQVVRNGTTTVEFGPNATQVDVLAAAAGDVGGSAEAGKGAA